MISKQKLNRFFDDLNKVFGTDPLRDRALAAIRDAEGVVVDVSDAYQSKPERRVITVVIKPGKGKKK